MTDFHTHILPKMDDGASSSAESIEMLNMLKQQHVDTVVLTPHYYSQREPMSTFLKRRRASIDRLLQVNSTGVTLKLGTEVYLSEYLFNINDISPLCIQNTRTLLLELPYGQLIDENVLDSVDRIITEYDVHPVIAHVERYPSLLRSQKHLEQLISGGCTLQVNLSSCVGFGNRRVLSLFKRGYIGAIGTDAHNMSTRTPDYTAGYARLQHLLNPEEIENLQLSMKKLLSV